MEHGYPCRAPFQDLHDMYKSYLPPKLQKLSPKLFCQAMIHSFGLSDKDFKFGVTRVFFRPGKYSEFDAIMKSDPENLRAIVGEAMIHSFGLSDKDFKFGVTRVFFRPGKYSEFDAIMKSDPENLRAIVGEMIHSFGLSDKDFKFGVTRVFFRPGKYSEFDAIMKSYPENLRAIVGEWLVKSRWRRSIFAVLSIIKLKNKILYRRQCLVTIQKMVRGHLARRRHAPRINGYRKVNALTGNLKSMETTAAQLKQGKDAMMKNIAGLRSAIVNAAAAIKSTLLLLSRLVYIIIIVGRAAQLKQGKDAMMKHIAGLRSAIVNAAAAIKVGRSAQLKQGKDAIVNAAAAIKVGIYNYHHRKVNALTGNLKSMETTAAQLKQGKDAMMKHIAGLRSAIVNAAAAIKVGIHHHHCRKVRTTQARERRHDAEHRGAKERHSQRCCCY
ncbi:myosin head (motor domain) domain-containing protein [Phthorimaea operculella]|nr:myosin head (motor domain) domain-containing protein [Phthorimaea operculella]